MIEQHKIEFKRSCPKCDAVYVQEITQKVLDDEKYRKFCSRKCANSRTWSEADKQKKSLAARQSLRVKEANSNRPKRVRKKRPKPVRSLQHLHSKMKGTLGELAVTKDLIADGWDVFVDVGDCSKIDLIALRGSKLVKIQVKTRDVEFGAASVGLKSSGPGYSYSYTSDDIDYMAMYVPERDMCLYVPMSWFEEHDRKSITIRIDEARNNQKNVHPYEGFRKLQ